MASPVFRSNSAGDGTGTGFTATEPAGAAEGDALLIEILVEDTHSSFTPAAGWEEIRAQDAGPFTARTYGIRRGSSAPALNFSWVTSRYFEWSISAWSGIVASGDFVESSAVATPNIGTGPTPPPVTTLTADTTVVVIAWTWGGWGGGGATPPSGYTLRYGPTGFDHGVASLAVATATTETPGAWANAGNAEQTAFSIVLASIGGTPEAPPAPAPSGALFFGSNF